MKGRQAANSKQIKRKGQYGYCRYFLSLRTAWLERPMATSICRRSARRSCLPAVPPTCPKLRSVAVIHGQPRSILMPSGLEDQPIGSGPRELPKLAVLQALIGLAVPGHQRLGNPQVGGPPAQAACTTRTGESYLWSRRRSTQFSTKLLRLSHRATLLFLHIPTLTSLSRSCQPQVLVERQG